MISASWYSCPCIIPSDWMSRNCDLLLTSRIQQLMRYHFFDYVTYNLKFCFADRHLSSWLWWSELSCYELPYGESWVTGNWMLPPTISMEFSPSITQLPRHSILQSHSSQDYASKLARGFFPSQVFRWEVPDQHLD